MNSMLFVPLNKHLLVEELKVEQENKSLIALPEDYVNNTKGRYTTVRFIGCAEDCNQVYEELFDSKQDVILAVDQTMLEDVFIGDQKFLIIHQNHIVGVMEKPYED